jgi:hypothetical protein
VDTASVTVTQSIELSLGEFQVELTETIERKLGLESGTLLEVLETSESLIVELTK